MPQLVGMGEGEVGVREPLPRLPVEGRGSDTVLWICIGFTRMRRLLMTIACAAALWQPGTAQEKPTQSGSPKSTTVIGCLAGPGDDNLYTLTSMQHRTGVKVVGGEELKKGAGAKVKLTGAWETLPESDAPKGDAGRRFRATDIAVMEEKCKAPAPVTPVSKKKQAQKK